MHMRLIEVLPQRASACALCRKPRARDAILRGTVRLDGAVAEKPGEPVHFDSPLAIDDPARSYVSRAALKLIAGLDRFGFDVAGRTALDVGSSTGGFTQVLLKRGAAHVVAVDVGHGQLDARLRGDPRVAALEGLNARRLDESHLGGRTIDAVVCDVSFISLKLALPPALALAAAGSWAILLVKPQFEVGRSGIGKGGLVRDASQAERVAAELRTWLDAEPGWRALGLAPSPIEGGDGNREFLLAATKDR
jgi:23S rRNA (cytidine1920-2'-O)/16S rRNA (cytidine1409-2'-O)-methyltransferase